MTPDFTTFVAPQKMMDEVGIKFMGVGWYQKGKDWLLVTRVDSTTIRIMVWNDRDPRKLWKQAVEMPTYHCEGGDVINAPEPWMPPFDDNEGPGNA